jgi:ribonuclease R
MIRLSDLPGDFYELDKDNYRLIGQRNKKIIQFGDEIQVVVKAANLLDRTIDFEVVDNRPDYVKDREKEERGSRRGGDRPDRSRGPRNEKPGAGRGPGGKGGGRSSGGDKRRR